MAIANSYGLAFSISPARPKLKKQNTDDDEEYTLTLAPFCKAPKINFGQVKINTLVERTLQIFNPQQFPVKLLVSNQDLQINNMEIEIGKMSNLEFKIKWQPEKAENYKTFFQFEVMNCARLKFLVHAFGVCLAPEVKAKRKPLTMLQPLKREKSHVFPDNKTETPSLVTTSLTSKTTISTTTIAHSINASKSTKPTFTTRVVNKENKDNNQIKPARAFPTSSSYTNNLKSAIQEKTFIVEPKANSSILPSIKVNIVNNSIKTNKNVKNLMNNLYDDDDDDEESNELKFGQTQLCDFENDITNDRKVEDHILRRNTCVIETPKYLKTYKLGQYNLDIPNYDMGIKNDQSPIRRAFSVNNIDSPSSLSFVDKTVVIVAGTESQIASNTICLSNKNGDTIDESKNRDMTLTQITNIDNESLINHLSSTAKRNNVLSSKCNDSNKPYDLDNKIDIDESNQSNYLNFPLNEVNDGMKKLDLTPKITDFLKPVTNCAKFSNDVTDLTLFSSTSNNKTIGSTQLIDVSVSNINSTVITYKNTDLNSPVFLRNTPIGKLNGFSHFKSSHTPIGKFDLVGKTNFSNSCSQIHKSVFTETRTTYSASATTKTTANQFTFYEEEIQSDRFEENNLQNIDLIHTRPYDENYLIEMVIRCQRFWRMKIFRKKVKELKEKQLNEKFSAGLNFCNQLLSSIKEIGNNTGKLIIKTRLEEEMNERLKEKMRLETEKKNYYAIIVQRKFKWKKFKSEFNRKIMEKIEARKQLEEQLKIMKQKEFIFNTTVIKCQRMIRMKLFRKRLVELKQQRDILISWAIKCQRWIRMKRFRAKLNELRLEELERQRIIQLEREKLIYKSVCVIQRKWRLYKFRTQMNKYRNACIKIQTWFIRDMSDRVYYLKLRRSTCLIQKIYKQRFRKRFESAVCIQSVWRMHFERSRFLIIKKSVSLIQNKARELLVKQIEASNTIKRAFRYYKFRKELIKYRKATIVIQNWHRSMQLRYEYLRKRRIIIQIQLLYKRIYLPRRESAAIRIQKNWRMYQAQRALFKLRDEQNEILKKLEEEKNILNRNASIIQAYWRGYAVRKQTNHILNSIRTRLSICIQEGDRSNTLGIRIRNSLQILRFPCVPIQQIIIALTDLDKVTRLSPECCKLFCKEGALYILYDFIATCNRSVPHMDLIKFCLQIFINLAKYNQTVQFVLEPQHSLSILVNLLQAYQSSNPNIFIDVCILFILMAQYPLFNEYLLGQESFNKKLLNIYSVLERRAVFKLKQLQTNQPLNSNAQLNCSIIGASSIPNNAALNPKKQYNVSFTMEPEWSLSRKNTVQLADPLSALEYLLDTLGIKIDNNISSVTTIKTPRKSILQSRDKSAQKPKILIDDVSNNAESRCESTSKLTKSANKLTQARQYLSHSKPNVSASANTASKTTTAKKQFAFNSLSATKLKQISKSEEPFENELDDHVSMCSNDSMRSIDSNATIKSIASFHSEKPRMNSTSISASTSKSNGVKKSLSTNFVTKKS